ncbi:DoxX family protein [Hymenobacter nivis]|uniref:DoxX family protein n=1 Tax=Hymenobacter nivis TaxID=1850093 RepID=A0A2Z3GIW1_9BACT|nr:DoxX family membrane protein [Hymenobacter nivis]AWM34069.1 DoxX family protein [Hymenobacter nivis]
MLHLISRYALAAVFVGAGLLHFIKPATYLRIMPPGLPAPLALVYVSGFFELAGGLGLLVGATRWWAALGLVLLLVAVFPANVYMAQMAGPLGVPAWAAWGRLPLQALLVWWAWAARR